MTSVQSHHVMSHSNTGYNLDNNLDALLDDLQSGVGHRGEVVPHTTLVNGSSIQLPPGATGYRETTTTVTQERNGVPTTSRDYQIEYLNPANSVTVLSERGSSPNPDAYLQRGTDASGKKVASYKTSSYEYKFSEKTTDAHGNPLRPETNYSVSKSERESSKSGAGNKNLNELDVLLQELNTPNPPRRSEHVSRSIESRVHRDYPQSSTPRSASLTRDAQQQFQQYGEIQQHSTPRSHHREVHQYVETPGTPRAPQRNVNVHKEVSSIEQRSHTSRRDSPSGRDRSVELSPTFRRRTPSPGGEFRPATFSSYPHSPAETRRSRSQTRYEDTHHSSQVSTTESKYRTNYTNHASTTRTDDPTPYRSPSPVSFPQHRSPSPVRRVVTRSDSGRAVTRSDSGRGYTPLANQPPLSDPSSPTVITYKYSSHSQQHSTYPGQYEDRRDGPHPFPTTPPQQNPGDQNPPKKVEELLASFQDNQRSYSSHNDHYYREEDSRHRQQDLQRSPSFERNLRPSNVKATQVYHYPTPAEPQTPPIKTELIPAVEKSIVQEKQVTRSMNGPPVYYPPGVELFARKEEAFMEKQSGGGKMRSKGKMKYKYEASEKSKEKSATRTTVVPACLPLCCALPCTIM